MPRYYQARPSYRIRVRSARMIQWQLLPDTLKYHSKAASKPQACVIIRIIIIYNAHPSVMSNVADLRPGETARIASIDAETSLQQRLAALGFREGKQLSVIRKARFNGPLHVRIGTTDVILRLAEARRIQIDQ